MLARFAAPLTRAAAPRCHRWLSTSLPRSAKIPEFPPDLYPASEKSVKSSPLYQKLANPEVSKVVFKFGAVMETQGLDMDKQPSMLQLGKLFLKPEVHEVAQELKDVLQKHDIDLTDQNIIQALTELLISSNAAK